MSVKQFQGIKTRTVLADNTCSKLLLILNCTEQLKTNVLFPKSNSEGNSYRLL